MKKTLLAVSIAVALCGCAAQDIATNTVVMQASTVADDARVAAELVLCRGITVGAWERAYGNDPVKAEAWKSLCKQDIKATP